MYKYSYLLNYLLVFTCLLVFVDLMWCRSFSLFTVNAGEKFLPGSVCFSICLLVDCCIATVKFLYMSLFETFFSILVCW